MKKRGLAILILVFAVILAMLIPSLARMIRRSRISTCAGHLHTLWHVRAHQYASSNDDRFPPNGGQYFLELQRGREPRGKGLEMYFCPLTDEERIPGRTSYRGPALPLKKLSPEDPCAADREENNGPGQGGNVLTMFGDVQEVGSGDPRWLRARVTTKE